MKGLVHPATSAFGATSIVMFALLKPLASPSHKEFYHWAGPVSMLLVPILVNFAGVWLCLMGALLWARKRFPKGGAALSILVLAIGWIVANLYRLHQLPHADRIVEGIGAGVCLLLGMQALLAVRRSKMQCEANALAATVLGFVAFSGVLMLGEGVVFSWQARYLNVPRALHASGAGTGARRKRILWIVFDELSYRQVYERPYRGLELPAFRRLAETAAVFSHVVPSGLYTDEVLPSLMTGRTYDRVRTGPAGRPLEVHEASRGTWERFDPHETVFQDALSAGYRTGVAGWYVPYCRIIPEVLDKCFWTAYTSLPGGMSAGRSIGWNSEQPIMHPLLELGRLFHARPSIPPVSVETASHQQDYRALAAEGDKLIEAPSMTFVMLHMPIPHPVGIYNRRTATFQTDRASYLDNLALCDLYLAHVREEMEGNGLWEEATVLVMGDHSWRVHLGGAKTPEWTDEERIASDDAQFDDRPMYLVKLPYERKALRVDAPFEAIRTRALIDQAISGKIQTPEELAAWASKMR